MIWFPEVWKHGSWFLVTLFTLNCVGSVTEVKDSVEISYFVEESLGCFYFKFPFTQVFVVSLRIVSSMLHTYLSISFLPPINREKNYFPGQIFQRQWQWQMTLLTVIQIREELFKVSKNVCF